MGKTHVPVFVVRQLALVATRNPHAGPCEYTCLDSSCLPSLALVCNGHFDCLDESDEQDCPAYPSPTPVGPSLAAAQDVSTVQIVTIVIFVVLTLGLITCILSHYKMGARSWSERRSRQSPQQAGRQQLQPPSCPQQYHQQHYTHTIAPQTSMLYSPASIKERQRLESEAHHDHQIRMQSVQTDISLELPPSIALPDGEGPPYSSLKNLKLRDPEQESEIYQGCIRPPPNRTIIEGDALPPFRSNSVSLLHKSSPPSGLARTLDGAPLVMRSHSMSSSRAQTSRISYPNTPFSPIQPPHSVPHLRIQPPILVGRSTTASSNSSNSNKSSSRTCECSRRSGEEFSDSDPPPRYSDVVISWDFGSVLNSQSNEGV